MTGCIVENIFIIPKCQLYWFKIVPNFLSSSFWWGHDLFYCFPSLLVFGTCLLFLKKNIGVQFLYYIVLVSAILQSESAKCISSDQSISRVRLFATPWTAAHQASLSITNSRSLLKPMSIESVMPSSHLILCRPLFLLPPIPPSIRVFSNESTLRMRWPKYWSFSFSISPSNEYPGLISFRMDWLNILAVQGTLKSLLQHHSSKASILQHSAFLTVQLSHPYMTTGKTIALTRRTFVGKVMSVLFTRLVITILPRSTRLLISWLQSPSAVILEPKEIKSDRVSSFPIYLPWSDGTRCHDLSFLNEAQLYIYMYLIAQSCPTVCDPLGCDPQAPLSMGFSRQEYWNGLPLPSPGDLPDSGIQPVSPALQQILYPAEPSGKPYVYTYLLILDFLPI